ncbi:MAG: 23S rRNA (adenine(2503)-C(2))-methyltransferase RlmN [Kiritimatiellae bacterium]|nr:23S rRNA (adenine(2503)-C(2))-methyltransferase RlmN [Kiritimatiellia bacterium]
MSDLKNLRDLTLPELEELAVKLDEPISRAQQLFSRLYRPLPNSFCQMHNISKKFLAKLNEVSFIGEMKLQQKETSSDGTTKYAFILTDGNIIESVLIPSNGRNTLCISSQSGCAMGCKFCLTSTMGFKRNLQPSEIVGQVLFIANELKSNKNNYINNIVFMGMGEPLANYDNTLKAINILQDEKGLGFSDRKITVSTCGLTPQIMELAKISGVNIAISLHAVDEETRTEIMPINKKYPLQDLLSCCSELSANQQRQILIEYILFKGINDSEADATKLAEALEGFNCKINLIPYNEHPALPYQQSTPEVASKFMDILCKAGHLTIIRHSRGSDISAACGQLASKEK